MIKNIRKIFQDVFSDTSFLVFVLGVAMVCVVGVIDVSYRDKLLKAKVEIYILEKENEFFEESHHRQIDIIKKQKELIDFLLEEKEKERKSKIYAEL